MVDFFRIFVMSWITEILIESNFWLGIYVLCILNKSSMSDEKKKHSTTFELLVEERQIKEELWFSLNIFFFSFFYLFFSILCVRFAGEKTLVEKFPGDFYTCRNVYERTFVIMLLRVCTQSSDYSIQRQYIHTLPLFYFVSFSLVSRGNEKTSVSRCFCFPHFL